MIDHPFLDFKELSDDELLEKTTDLQRNMQRAYLWGSSHDVITQLEWMLEMIEEEKLERYKRQVFDMQNAMFPEIVESDPEFKKADTNPTESIKPAKPHKNAPAALPMPNFNKEYLTPDKKVEGTEKYGSSGTS